MADPATFLARWSRRKRGAAEPAAPPPPEADREIPALSPIETLTAQSDYTPFMRAGVPEAIRNAALRRLWVSDPVYANLDGLVEYGEDYAAPFNAGLAVATVYRVLLGMPDPAEAALRPEESEADETGV
jgi:hypothetical protein